MQSNSTIERKPKKIVMSGVNGQYPHTTGLNTKNNSQIPSPTNSKLQRPQN